MDDLKKAILADEIYEIVAQLEVIHQNALPQDKATIQKNIERIKSYAEKLLENLNVNARETSQRAKKCAERADHYAQNASYILQEIRDNKPEQELSDKVLSDEQNANAAAEAAENAAAAGQADKAAEEADKAATSNMLLLIKLFMIRNPPTWKSKMPNLASRLITQINMLIATEQPGSSASISSFTSPRPAAAPSVGSFASASISSSTSAARPSGKPTASSLGSAAATSVGSFATPSVRPVSVPSDGLISDEELSRKIEKLPDSAVKRDLRQLIHEENDPILVSNETKAVLEKLNSTFGVNPYFMFHPLNGKIRITAKTGDEGLFYLQHPKEIAKLIYSLMDKADIELVNYPPELPVAGNAALATLLADINSNFSILQSELDSLKPQFTKKVASVFRHDALTKKTARQLIAEETKRLPRRAYDAKMAELKTLLQHLNVAKQTYAMAPTRTNANTIDTRAADVKSFLKARQKDSNSSEMALYKNKAGSYNSTWEWLKRKRYHEKAGGTKKERANARKTRRS